MHKKITHEKKNESKTQFLHATKHKIEYIKSNSFPTIYYTLLFATSISICDKF